MGGEEGCWGGGGIGGGGGEEGGELTHGSWVRMEVWGRCQNSSPN